MSTDAQRGNGSERLDPHGGRRLTIPGVGLVEIVQHEVRREDGSLDLEKMVITLEPLSDEQKQKLDAWLEHEWPKRAN